jgi:hypothetical protein
VIVLFADHGIRGVTIFIRIAHSLQVLGKKEPNYCFPTVFLLPMFDSKAIAHRSLNDPHLDHNIITSDCMNDSSTF